MAVPASERLVPVQAVRIELEAQTPFEALRMAFESEVPPVDEGHVRQLLKDGAEWRRFAQETAGPGIHRFVRFWEQHPTPIMRVGGADIPSASYLIGDYALLARMFRHDPGTLLYAPIRVELRTATPS